MNDDIPGLFSRPYISSKSASNIFHGFSPRARRSDESVIDDTEIRYQLPSKKLKLEDSPASASKPFPKYESHLELIQAKAESAKLQTKINSLERELVELKTQFDKEKENLQRENNKLESRVATVERQISSAVEKEGEAKNQIEKLTKNKESEKLAFNEKIKHLKERNLKIEIELSEKNQETDSRVETLWLQLSKEKKSSLEFRNSFEQCEKELSLQKSRNLQLAEELKSCIEQLNQTTKKYDEQSITLKQWREENEIATALRFDVADLKQLRQENAALKQQNQRFKNLSENTSLLHEQKDTLEESVGKLKREVEKLMNENNELKIIIARNQSPTSSQISLHEIDYLTKQCVEFKFEIQNKQDKINSLEQRLAESGEKLSKLEEDLKKRKEETLFYSMNITTVPKMSDDTVQTDDSWTTVIRNEEKVCESEVSREPDANLLSLLNEKDEQINRLMQKLGLVADYDPSQTKVVHFCMNPLDDAHNRRTNELENLRKDNASLKLRVEELEKFRPGHFSESAMVIDDDVTSNVCKKLEEQNSEKIVAELRAEVAKLTEQRERVAKINQEIGSQFREMSTVLTGYQLKMKESGLCVMQSVFEPPEQHFLFQKGQNGQVDLLGNPYASNWQDFIDTYLTTDNSIPAFLAAVTLQLFSKAQNESSNQ